MTPADKIRAFIDANKGRNLVLYVPPSPSVDDAQVSEARSLGIKVTEHPMVRYGEAYIMTEFDPMDYVIHGEGVASVARVMP